METMILKTIEDCKNYTPSLIDYSTIEFLQREKNIEELYKYLQFRNIPVLHSLLTNKFNKIHTDKYPHDLINWYMKFSQKNFSNYETQIRETLKWYSKYHKDFEVRIINYCEQWNLDKKYVLYRLNNTADIANIFIKDPSKQTLHQHFAAQWIADNIPFIEDFKELPTSGTNAYYIYEGKLQPGNETDTAISGKSIDFTWKYKLKDKTLSFYATHKHTKIHGGSQDNQFYDVVDFHKHAKSCNDPNMYFLSITDGQYYQDRYTKAKSSNMNAIEFMRSEYCGSRNNATCTNTLLLDILKVIKNWILSSFDDELDDSVIRLELEKINITERIYINFLEKNNYISK